MKSLDEFDSWLHVAHNTGIPLQQHSRLAYRAGIVSAQKGFPRYMGLSFIIWIDGFVTIDELNAWLQEHRSVLLNIYKTQSVLDTGKTAIRAFWKFRKGFRRGSN